MLTKTQLTFFLVLSKETKKQMAHTLSVTSVGQNDIRIVCKNKSTIDKISSWYQQLTKQKVKEVNSKYVNVITLDSARKDKVFNSIDAEIIISDFILSIGYRIIETGQLNVRQASLNRILFISQ